MFFSLSIYDFNIFLAIHQMVSLLKMKQNVKFLAICTDCLHLLGYGCSQAKVQMVQAEASVQLVHIMNTYTYEKVKLSTFTLIRELLRLSPSAISGNNPKLHLHWWSDFPGKRIRWRSHNYQDSPIRVELSTQKIFETIKCCRTLRIWTLKWF